MHTDTITDLLNVRSLMRAIGHNEQLAFAAGAKAHRGDAAVHRLMRRSLLATGVATPRRETAAPRPAASPVTFHSSRFTFSHYADLPGRPLHVLDRDRPGPHPVPRDFAILSPADADTVRRHFREHHRGDTRASARAMDGRRLALLVHDRHGRQLSHLSKALPLSRVPKVGHHVAVFMPHLMLDPTPIENVREFPTEPRHG